MYYAHIYDIRKLLIIFVMKYHEGNETEEKTDEDLAYCLS
jgi:hypothetical protein